MAPIRNQASFEIFKSNFYHFFIFMFFEIHKSILIFFHMFQAANCLQKKYPESTKSSVIAPIGVTE